MQVSRKTSLESLQHLKKEGRDELDFLHVDKYQSFLQVDILSFLRGLASQAKSSQTICIIFEISQERS